MNLEVAQVLASQSAVFLTCLLTVSAVHKASRWSVSVAAARALLGSASGAVAPALLVAMGAEITAAMLFAASVAGLPNVRALAAVLAALLFSSYTLLLVRAMRQNRRDINCGCSFGASHAPLSRYHLIRNASLIALAVFVAWVPSAANHESMVTLLLAAVTLFALYGALDQVVTIRPLRTGETR